MIKKIREWIFGKETVTENDEQEIVIPNKKPNEARIFKKNIQGREMIVDENGNFKGFA